MKIERITVASADGCPLTLQRAEGRFKSGIVALLGHGPSVTTRLMQPCIAALCEQGAVVWAGDLRGHGASISAMAPKAHLDPETGWEKLRDDMACFAQIAFADCPLDQRLLVGGSLSGHLMLDLLARTQGLARHLVLAGPTPPQRGVTKVIEGFLRVRRVTRPVDAPDPQLLHHIYRFLRAHILTNREISELAMLETLTADPEQIATVMADPTGFPTPTLGYWLATLPGIQRSWTGQAGAEALPEDLRILVLSGPEDPQSQGGKLLPKVVQTLEKRGVAEVITRLLPHVRANILIDAGKVPVAQEIFAWMCRPASMPPQVPSPTSPAQVAPLQRTSQLDAIAQTEISLDLSSLIAKCYAAIDDDNHWIDLIIRIARAAEGEDQDQDIDALIEILHPHWQRAFELREELRWAAKMGRIYHEVIDRLELGVALLDAEHNLGHANPAFKRIMARLMGASDANMARVTQALVMGQESQIRAAAGSATGQDIPLMLDGRIVGVWIAPGRADIMGLPSDTLGGLLVLRDPSNISDSQDNKIKLMMLAYGLTQKESSVALALADGLATSEVATKLGITEHTIRSHVKQIFDKMQITSRTELSHRILSGPLGWLTSQEGPKAQIRQNPTLPIDRA